MEETRLFVGNIPPQATEQDISNEFGYYGSVKSVELKRKTDANCYAFVNIEIEEKFVQKCNDFKALIKVYDIVNRFNNSFRYSRIWPAKIHGKSSFGVESKRELPGSSQKRA